MRGTIGAKLVRARAAGEEGPAGLFPSPAAEPWEREGPAQREGEGINEREIMFLGSKPVV
ncbi:MAG TPA: hypothetical protein PK694_06745 [Rhodospirillales bacterium]|mgnify:CR=1 FL=1|nr:hypothetical protein [Rhodospirillales bacterium]